MADDTLLIAAHVSRRDRLVAARRRRRRRIVVITVIVVVLLGSAGAFALTRDHDPTSNQAAAKHAGAAAGRRPAELPEAKQLKRQAPPRALTHADPLRLWVGGDSLAGAVGPALGKIAGATGVVHTQVDYRVSSGIASDGVRDWPARAAQQMSQYYPEAVVFEVGTNDASIVNSHENADGVPEWEPAYRLRVARMMDTLRGPPGHRRTVLWVAAPPMSLGWRDKGVRELNRVMREEAKKRAPDVVYVDAYKLFEGENGGYSSTVRTLQGVERVRIGDGVHFTEAGADYLGAVLYSLLDSRWAIDKDADRAQPINWAESVGSSGNGGGSSGSGSSCCSSRHRRRSSGAGSGSSNNETPGTPAPPPSLETTAPPASSPATSPGTSTPAPTGGSGSSAPPSGTTAPAQP
jgi:hypothetical protein